jgi:hypothetical protein
MTVDVQERRTQADAKEGVIESLGEFESPLMTRLTGASYGDVAFAMPNETALLFARGNLVILLRNSGPIVKELGALARTLDQLLIGLELK